MAAPYLIGAGLVLQGYGNYLGNMAQAQAEEQNASFYREQAAFAEKAGERARMIFDRESIVLHGDQLSAFAKAGVDISASSTFLAKQMLYRQQESYAIKEEADMNVRLANLRADQADETARSLRDPLNNILQLAGPGIQALGSMGGS